MAKSTTHRTAAVRRCDEHVFVYRNGSTARTAAARLLGKGLSDYQIARRTGASRSSVQRWRVRGLPAQRDSRPAAWRPSDPASYSYLLGVYLGDGYVAKASHSPVLEISLDARYPGIAEECSKAISRVLGVRARTSQRRTASGGQSIRVTAGSQLWPVVFPQHGPGKKHKRKIALEEWQQEIVDRHPRRFLRGLLHADGSRSVNRFSVDLKRGPRQYAYVRYFFTNLSVDIQGLFCASCDKLGIRWTRSSARNISVAERRSVALLDCFVGPKDDAGGGT